MARSDLSRAIDAIQDWPEGASYDDETLKRIESAARALRKVSSKVRQQAAELMEAVE